MITEHALLNVKPSQRFEFIDAIQVAYPYISRQAGFISLEILQAADSLAGESDNQFLLLVRWDNIVSHKVGFRGSEDYQKWSALLHHFYDPIPTVKYYEGNILNV